MKKFLAVLIIMLFPAAAHAELMTVNMLKEMLQKGSIGELAATTYVQGVVDGMLGMDSVLQKEGKMPPEFCGIHGPSSSGIPIQHPAYHTRPLVSSWERQGYPMDAPAVDMVLSYMTKQFSRKN
jgi:hypothetical protein